VALALINASGPRLLVAFSIYGSSLFLFYIKSTLYHALTGRNKGVFHVLDHHAICSLYAGSYTQFMLVTINGVVGWWLFGAFRGMTILVYV